MAKTISEKQLAFCREYIVDNNAGQAAIRAGYAPAHCRKRGNTLLRNPLVMAELNKLRGEQIERTNLTADYVLAKITASAEAADARGQHGSALKGWELLGKHLGMFTENRSIFADGELHINLKWDNGDGND